MFGETEQPQSNQSSFGPSNQNSTYDFNTQNASQNTGITGGGYAAPRPPGYLQNNITDTNGQPAYNPQQNAPLPWQQNQVGHDGSTQNGMNRDSWRNAWMSSGTSNNQGMDQWLQQNGGQRMNDSGVVRTPFGETLDMGIAFRTGQGKPGWTDIGMNNTGQQQQQMPQFGQGSFGPQNGMQQPGMMNPEFMQQLMQMFKSAPPLATMQQSQSPMANKMSMSNPNLYQNSVQPGMDISSLISGNFGRHLL